MLTLCGSQMCRIRSCTTRRTSSSGLCDDHPPVERFQLAGPGPYFPTIPSLVASDRQRALVSGYPGEATADGSIWRYTASFFESFRLPWRIAL